MAHNKPNSNGKRGARPPRQSGAGGKRIRIEATRRERVDPQMIALCYWLLAQRIVQEADEANAAAAAQPPNNTTPDDSTAQGRSATGASS